MKLVLLCLLISSLAMAQTGTISGRVVDENGYGVIGAAVQVTETGQGVCINDPSGRFEILNVPDGIYSLRISSLGFRSKYATCVGVGSAETNPITIRLGPDKIFEPDSVFMSDANIAEFKRRISARHVGHTRSLMVCGNEFDSDYYELCDLGALGGSLRGEDCEHIVDFALFLNEKKVDLSLDELGNWSITRVQPGSYEVRVTALGFVPFVQDSLTIERGYQKELTITLLKED